SGLALFVAVTGLVSSVVAAFYYLRLIKVMYFDEPITASSVVAPLDVRVVLCINGALVLILGMLPSGLMALCGNAIRQMLGT
ncbi:MAG: NADH:ubiquinone oxidoreductase subunit N, partial [Rhodoferax sp.]